MRGFSLAFLSFVVSPMSGEASGSQSDMGGILSSAQSFMVLLFNYLRDPDVGEGLGGWVASGTQCCLSWNLRLP